MLKTINNFIMRTISLLFAALLMAALFSSCQKIKGAGEVITETRYSTGFTGISLAVDGNVYFTSGSDYSIKISGQSNVIRHITTDVEGNRLIIRLEHGFILGPHETINVYVTAPNIGNLEVSGSGNIYGENNWTGSDMSVSISGSGNISLNSVESDNFHATISGSGSISANNGLLGNANLRISGSGSINFQNVRSNDVYTTTSGSGDTYVYAIQSLDVSISGSGNVYYNGNPSINAHIAGSGRIVKI